MSVPGVISPESARDRATSTPIVFADVRWYPDGRDARIAYQESHISDAVFVDVERDLCATGHQPPSHGRHPLPEPEAFAEAMGRLGIGDETWVVAYDDTGGMTASRLVVMLRMIGKRASLLDGGLAVWSATFPDLVERGEGAPRRTEFFTPQPWPEERLVTREEVVEITHRGADKSGVVILDARSRERYTGSAPSGPGTLDPRSGHIPGAVNSPWTDVVSPETRRLRTQEELKSHFERLGVGDALDVISSCGSGISACLNILAVEHAGLQTPRLFVPSWSGWASVDDNPAETGESSSSRIRLERAVHRHRTRAVGELRHARRRRRLADLEWFDALYRVYLAAFVFGGGAMFIAGFVPDEPVSTSTAQDVWANGPAWLGLAAVIGIAIGMRSGSRGGPLAIEEADVRHVLLAPVDRRRALFRPAVQSIRTAVFATTLMGALAGHLAARRLPGTAPDWVLWGSSWGATAGALYIGAALVAHGLHMPRWLATSIAVALVSWQMLTALPASTGIAIDSPGLADLHGELGLSAHGLSASVLVYPVIALALICLGLSLLGRQSLDALQRRSALVSQLRFAVTVQDLRTVTLLRRRLSDERSRTRPWTRFRRSDAPTKRRIGAEWTRAWQGLMRFPLSRALRIVLLCVLAGLASATAIHGTTPAIVVTGVALFMVALELLEPLAQEVDQSDRTSSYPVARGLIHLRLASPIAALVPLLGTVMVSTMVIVEDDTWLVAIIGSISALVAAFAGACVNIVSGSPDPTATAVRQNTMPPEVAGTVSIIKSLWPVALSIAGGLPFAFASVAQGDRASEAAAFRGAIAVVLGACLVGAWVRWRDDLKRSLDRAITESRGSTQKGYS